MVWAYVVVMAMSTPVTSETEFVVQAPNMAFKNEEDCQKFKYAVSIPDQTNI